MRPLIESLGNWLLAERARMSKYNPVAKAVNYMFEEDGRWKAFARFLDDGRICLTDNAAERALRCVALGREAWLKAIVLSCWRRLRIDRTWHATARGAKKPAMKVSGKVPMTRFGTSDTSRFSGPGAVSAERRMTLISAINPRTFQASAHRTPILLRQTSQPMIGAERPIRMSGLAPEDCGHS